MFYTDELSWNKGTSVRNLRKKTDSDVCAPSEKKKSCHLGQQVAQSTILFYRDHLNQIICFFPPDLHCFPLFPLWPIIGYVSPLEVKPDLIGLLIGEQEEEVSNDEEAEDQKQKPQGLPANVHGELFSPEYT